MFYSKRYLKKLNKPFIIFGMPRIRPVLVVRDNDFLFDILNKYYFDHYTDLKLLVIGNRIDDRFFALDCDSVLLIQYNRNCYFIYSKSDVIEC